MIVALFREEESLIDAVGRLRAAGIDAVETYTPAPLRDAPRTSPVPVIVLLGGLIGAFASLGLQTYAYTLAYPFPIGGRPQFAWPSFTPTVFENAVLVAIVSGFVAFMLVNRLPRLYDRIDEADLMRQASQDGWIVAVRSTDEPTLRHAHALLEELGARIESVPP